MRDLHPGALNCRVSVRLGVSVQASTVFGRREYRYRGATSQTARARTVRPPPSYYILGNTGDDDGTDARPRLLSSPSSARLCRWVPSSALLNFNLLPAFAPADHAEWPRCERREIVIIEQLVLARSLHSTQFAHTDFCKQTSPSRSRLACLCCIRARFLRNNARAMRAGNFINLSKRVSNVLFSFLSSRWTHRPFLVKAIDRSSESE